MSEHNTHTIEKIGGTSMSDYESVRNNIVLGGTRKTLFQRVFVVSSEWPARNL